LYGQGRRRIAQQAERDADGPYGEILNHGCTGWPLIRLSFVFFAIWNINTFINHGISTALDPAQFQGQIGGLPRYFRAHSFRDFYFFFGKMDHLLCIPAGLCLGLGLRKMHRASQRIPSEDVY